MYMYIFKNKQIRKEEQSGLEGIEPSSLVLETNMFTITP